MGLQGNKHRAGIGQYPLFFRDFEIVKQILKETIVFIFLRCTLLNWAQVRQTMADFKFFRRTLPIMMMGQKQDLAGGDDDDDDDDDEDDDDDDDFVDHNFNDHTYPNISGWV